MIELAKPLLELKKRQLSKRQLQQPKIVLGQQGEEQAVQFLLTKKLHILDRNVRFGNCELDIVALDPINQEVVFVEVKTRQGSAYEHPALAVNYRKKAALRKTALKYLHFKQLKLAFRFDTVTVLPNKIDHFENITW